MRMSVYEREWYRKENEKKQRRQEGADAMWNEVEKSGRTKKPDQPQDRRTTEAPRPKAETPKPKAEAVKPQDKLIPSCCPLCDYTIQLRVPYPQLREYSYTCPACKTKISVRAGETKDGKTSAIFTVLGILALLVYTLSQWSNIAGLFT